MDGAGAVVSFVGLGLQVCQSLYKYYESWRNCREDIAAICDTLQRTQKILAHLQDVVVTNSPNTKLADLSYDTIQKWGHNMEKLSKKLGKIQDSKGTGGFLNQTKARWERVTYPLKESTILKLRDLLHEQELELLLVLSTLGM